MRKIDIALASAEHATWCPATIVHGRPMLQLFADFDVMNASECKVVLVSARLRKPATEGLVRMDNPKRGVAGTYPLEPFTSTRASVYFFVALPAPPAGTNFMGDVGLVDQFGNTHWLEKIRFRMGESPREDAPASQPTEVERPAAR